MVELEELERALAEALREVEPPKVEGGSPARRQWIAAVIAVQNVLLANGSLGTRFREVLTE